MDIYQAIENWKTEYFMPFCLKLCNGDCCQKPYNKIQVNKKQIDEIFKVNQRKDLKIPANRVEGEEDLFWISTYQNQEFPYCPAYCAQTKMCLIHHLKPKICKSFPIKIVNDEVHLHSECLLAKKLLTPALEELKNICIEYNYSLYIG